jgi:VCBS repeat-containing protein
MPMFDSVFNLYLRSLPSRLRSSRPVKRPTRRRPCRPPAVERLEDRTVPTTFIVNTTSDTQDANPGDGLALDSTGNTSLRAAIMEANALPGADTIQVPAGTYRLTLAGANEDAARTGDLDITDTLTIVGDGRDTTVIDGRGLDRVFHVRGAFNSGSPTGPTVTISSLTVTGGQAPSASGSPGADGGGVLNEFSTLTLDNVVVRGNRTGDGTFAGSGGGVYTNNGTTTISNSTVTQNTTGNGTVLGGNGGGVGSLTSVTTIRDSDISNNRTGDGGQGTLNAGDGGGIYSASAEITRNGFLTVLRTTVTDNTVGTNQRGDGGGIISHDEQFVLDSSVVSGNTAWRAGGVELEIARSSSISNSTISGNTATAGGAGGLYVTTSSDHLISGTVISGTTISANQAPNSNQFDGGGGIINEGQIDAIINSTISGNSTNAVGGGIANYDNIGRIVNVTIASNTGSDGGGLYHMNFVNFTPVIGELTNTLIADNTATTTLNEDFVQLGVVTTAGNNLIETRSGNSTVNGVNGNIVGIDPKLGPLANNGGPTQTQALLSGSAAINAGTAAGAPTTDQRGLPRPSGSAVDIGAFEFQFPLARDDSYSVNEDTPLSVAAAGVLANDTDPNGATLTVSAVNGSTVAVGAPLTLPSGARLTLNANGSFNYLPRLDFNGTDIFTYQATNSQADSNVATVTITVNPVNDAPRPTPPVRNVTTDEDVPVGGQLTAIDPEGDPFTFSSPPEFAPQHGSVTVNPDGTWTYTPAANYYGTDTFGYRVTDDKGASGVGAVNITINPVNDPPVAVNDRFSVDEDTVLTLTVAPATRLRMVSDPGEFIGQGQTYDYTPAAASFWASPNFANGVSLEVDPPDIATWWNLDFAAANQALLAPGVYLDAMRFAFPDPGHPGLDVSGSGRGSNTLTGQFTVHDVVRNADQSQILSFAASFEQHSEGKPPALRGFIQFNSTFGTGAGVLANDTDPEGDLLTAVLVSGPQHGTLTFRGDGTFTYTPNPNFSGTDTFTYRANDGEVTGNVATVTITVNPVNAAPVATNDAYSVSENHQLTVAPAGVLANDSDPDGDPLTAVLVSGPSHGTLALNADGSFTYTPAPNFNGTDTFTYKANDGQLNSNVATVTITVTPVNDAPVAANDSYNVSENNTLNLAAPGVLANDTDADGDPLTAILVSGPAHGTLALNADGSFNYTPAAGYSGADSFTYKANDGLLDSNVATVSLTVSDDAPVANNDSFAVSKNNPLTVPASGVLANDTDANGDPLTAVLVSGPAHGTLTLNANGSFTYTPAAGYTGGDSFTYKANDGQLDSNVATVTLTVNDDAPVADNDSYSTDENTPLTVSAPAVLANDTDANGDPLTAVLTVGPSHGTVRLNADGSFTYTPGANFYGVDQFSYRASDGQLTSGQATVTITVNHVNQAPTVTVPGAQTAYVNVDKTISGLSVGDVDSPQLAVTFAVGHGTLRLGSTAGLTVTGNGTGSVTLSGRLADLNAALAGLVFRGGSNFSGTDTLLITASDGTLSSRGSVAITVKSAAKQAADLQAQVNALRDAGVLNHGQAKSLNAKLSLHGNDGDVGRVQDFLIEVGVLLRAGVLTQAQADTLVGPGIILLTGLIRR